MHLAISASNTREEERVKWKIENQRQDKAEEYAQILKKECLMHEIELGILNTMRYRTLWWKMMMKIEMPWIAKDTEIAWRNFDRALDIKNYRISFLMDELAEAKEQYQKNTKSHIKIIDQLLESYKERMKYEERNYQQALNETFTQMDAEINKTYYQQNEIEISLQSITHDIQQQIHLEESLNNMKSKIDAFVEDSKDVRRLSVAQLENQLQNSWENLQQISLDYKNKTKNRRKYYEILEGKDEENQQVIVQQLLHIVNLFKEIQKFRCKILTYNATTKKEISKIQTEHAFFQTALLTVKNCLFLEETKDKNQLKILLIEYNKTIKHLERFVFKGNQLLKLMQICYKYEIC